MEISYQDAANDAQTICSWLESFKLNVNPSRIARYRKLLGRLAVDSERVKLIAQDENPEEYLLAFYEFAELSIIHQAFHDRSPPGIEALLYKLISGPFSYVDEKNKNSGARNFAFEAALAARLNISGIHVSFKYTGDIFARLENHALYFQCKRLASKSNIRKNVSDAVKQLRKDFETSSGARSHGFIALDITKIVNPQFDCLTAENSGKAASQNEAFRNAFIREHIENLRISTPRKLIGILVRNSYICFNEEAQKYSYDQGYTIVQMDGISSSKLNIYEKLFEIINTNVKPRRLTLR